MQHDSDVGALAARLIQCRSVCPDDAGAQEVLKERLELCGFQLEPLFVDGIHSLLAIWGQDGPLVAFSGHSDVVPAGNEDDWSVGPFAGEFQDGILFGRGAVDMKGPLAASVVAAERFVQSRSEDSVPIRIGFLIAGDEEVMANHGTNDLLAKLKERGDRVAHCIVTESTSHEKVGDMVKVGRRGSMVGELTVKGVQGHSAYPHLAKNPISAALTPLKLLEERVWGEGFEGFPPTSFQITNIQAGTGAANVIPGALSVVFNFRFSPEFTAEQLQSEVEAIMRDCPVEWSIRWSCDAYPFLTSPGLLSETVAEAIREHTGLETELSTTGGTSDARFIAPTGAEVIEFGGLSALCHQVDERVAVDELDRLAAIYQSVLDRLAEHYRSK